MLCRYYPLSGLPVDRFGSLGVGSDIVPFPVCNIGQVVSIIRSGCCRSLPKVLGYLNKFGVVTGFQRKES